MKHAYLIIAHNDWPILQKLVMMLDDVRNDIFVHIDKKAGVIPELSTRFSNLYCFSEIKTYWGDVSQIETELFLFEEAHMKGKYDYYHLLSGVDLPIKSNDYIDRIFTDNRGKEFIDIYDADPVEIDRKVNIWHLFPHRFRGNGTIIDLFARGIRAIIVQVQLKLRIKRGKEEQLHKGAQWVSVTDSFVKYILRHKQELVMRYSHTFCSDEIFLQTLCMNSPFKDKLYDMGAHKGNGALRYIDWQGGTAVKILNGSDFDALMKSPYLFARKFSSSNMDVVDQIFRSLK